MGQDESIDSYNYLGKEGLEVYNFLQSNGPLTDEEISDEIDMRLNTVRKYLYKLYDLNWAKNERVKEEKIGWYVYKWGITDKGPTKRDN